MGRRAVFGSMLSPVRRAGCSSRAGEVRLGLIVVCLLFASVLAWFMLEGARGRVRDGAPGARSSEFGSPEQASPAPDSGPTLPMPRESAGAPEAAVPERPTSSPESDSAPPTPVSATESMPMDNMERLLASEDARLRFEGLRLLAAAAPEEALPEILDYLEETRDAERALLQRLAAVALLGELEELSVSPHLHALYGSEEDGLRRAAAMALARHGDETLVQRELIDLGQDLAHPDGGVRARAAEQAAELAGPSAIPVLLPLLQDTNSDVRARAVDGLWRSGDPAVLPELERMLEDPVALVRERARRAVDALKSASASDPGSEPR